LKFEVEKFNGKSNFELWKLKMRDLLVQQGLQKALGDKSKKPTVVTEWEWEDLDAKALSTIRLCLADDVLFNIVGEDTTSSLWSKLESLYMTKSLTSRIYLKRQLYSVRMKEGTKVVDHLNTFNTLIVQMTSMKVKFEDEDKAIRLLCSLPESWDNLVTSINFSSIEVLDYDSIVGALLAEEMRRNLVKKPQLQRRCWSEVELKRRMREVLLDLSQDTERVKQNAGTVAKQDISRKIDGRERNLRKTLRRKQIWL
jgi:hypothetical protein